MNQRPQMTIPEGLLQWIESSLADGRNVLAESNQGTVLLFEGDGLRLIVKSAMGRGALRRARQATLEREYAAYGRFEALPGAGVHRGCSLPPRELG